MAIVSVRQAGLGGFTKNRRLSYTFPSTMGMVLLSPTSIAFSGTSASIGANGQVTFTAVTSLSLNGVFSAAYDNYVISMRTIQNTGSNDHNFRLRTSGSDATASNYTWQYLYATNTSVSGARSSSNLIIAAGGGSVANGYNIAVYGPHLAQPTALRTTAVSSENNATFYDGSGTHSLSTSYDGFTIFLASNNITGALQVYGVRS